MTTARLRVCVIGAGALLALISSQADAGLTRHFTLGLSMSTQRCEPSAPVDQAIAWGVEGGVRLALDLTSVIGVVGEARVVQRGAVYDPDDLDGKLEVNYVSIPLMISVSPARSGERWFVCVGPHANVLLSDPHTSAVDWLPGEFKRTYWGVDVSVGAVRDRLLAEIRYSYPLTDCYDSEGITIRNHAVSVVSGVAF